MAFKLTKADEDALENVTIFVDGAAEGDSVTLNSETLMFPPVITKDSKTADWMEVPSGSFEPFKYYVQSKSRQIALEFQWVVGGQFTPEAVHDTTSKIKAYFYGAYFGGVKSRYPTVTITRFYGLFSKNAAGESSTWRMMGVDVKRSKEMTKIGGRGGTWYPLHTTLTMTLESASQLADELGEDDPVFDFSNLVKRPILEWY